MLFRVQQHINLLLGVHYSNKVYTKYVVSAFSESISVILRFAVLLCIALTFVTGHYHRLLPSSKALVLSIY